MDAEEVIRQSFLKPSDVRGTNGHGGRIGRYLLLEVLGRGGTSTVYRARDPVLDRDVALKVLKEEVSSARVTGRFRREATAAARLRHPNIVAVHEMGIAEDALGSTVRFIAMDFIAGSTLAGAKQGMGLRERVSVLETVAHAVSFAHSEGVIHRDLKPQNVLVEPAGPQPRVYLTDFGLAKLADDHALTRTGAVMGTPYYMAPEQVSGRSDDIGPCTDIWALGVMLYELLTDRTPFFAPTAAVIYQKILCADPAPPHRLVPDVPPDLETICLRAMEKEPSRRYLTAAEFADDLRRFLAGERILATPVSTWQFLARKTARHRGAALATGASVVVIGALAIWAYRAGLDLSREQASRRREALAALSAAISERKRDLRMLKVPADRAWRDLEEAVRAADAHVRERPEDPRGYCVRARGRTYLGELEAAEADLRAALKLCPELRPAWSLLGVVKIEDVRRRHALQQNAAPALEEALAAFARGAPPGREREEWERWELPWTRDDPVLLRVARACLLLYHQKDAAEARRVLQEGIDEYRAEEYALHMGSCVPEALKWYSTAIEWAPGYETAHFHRGSARHRAGDAAGAIGDYDRAIEIKRDFWAAHYNRAAARAALGDPHGALADYDRAIELRPDSADAHNNRGKLRADLDDLAGAIADYDRAIELRRDFALSWYNRAIARARSGDLTAAVADCSRAIELKADFAEAYSNRGNMKTALGDLDGAFADFARAIQIDPTLPEAYYNRAIAKQKGEDWKGSVADLEAALRVAPRQWPFRPVAERLLEGARQRVDR